MLHFLVLTTGTLFSVALLTGLLLGYAGQRGLLEVRAPAGRGAILGVCLGAALALLEYTTALVVREYYNLVTLVLLLILEFAVWIRLFLSRALAPEKAADSVLRGLFFLLLAAWGAFYLPDIFIYPSHFAVGVTNIVSSEFIFIVTGYLFGLALCLLAGYAMFRVCRVLPLAALFPLLSLALLAFCLTQLINVGQILLGRSLVPRSDLALDLIIFLLDHQYLLLFVLVGTALLMACLLWRKSASASIPGENRALRRKNRSRIRSSARWSKTAALFLLLGLLTLTAGKRFDEQGVTLSPPLEIAASDGFIIIPLSMVNDGALHRFVHKTQRGVDVRYIVVKKSESAYGVGLDACDVCGPTGYYERKGQIVCIMCDVVMNKSTIGFYGGCNPVPLKFTLQGGAMRIDIRHLEAEAPRFM